MFGPTGPDQPKMPRIPLSLSPVSLLILLTVIIYGEASRAQRTGYACEGQQLKMSCDQGSITVVRANYGRYSISICNDHGNLDWRTDCTSAKSYNIISNRCNSKQSCELAVASKDFEPDPCPGTKKYLEVQYTCGQGDQLGGNSSSNGGQQLPNSRFPPPHQLGGGSAIGGGSNRPRTTVPTVFLSSPASTLSSTSSFPSVVDHHQSNNGRSSPVSANPIRDVISVITPRDSSDNKPRSGLAPATSAGPNDKSISGPLSPPSLGGATTQWTRGGNEMPIITATSKRPSIIGLPTSYPRTTPPSAAVAGPTLSSAETSTGRRPAVSSSPANAADRFYPSNFAILNAGPGRGPLVPTAAPPTASIKPVVSLETTTRDFWDEFKKSMLIKDPTTAISSTTGKSILPIGLPAEVFVTGTGSSGIGGQIPMGSTSSNSLGLAPPKDGTGQDLRPSSPTSTATSASSTSSSTYRMLLVIISSLVAVIFCCLTLGLLIACRTRCNRLTIYKNLCVNLILLELALVLIVYRPPGPFSAEAAAGASLTTLMAFGIPCLAHLLLLNLFIWSFIETVRVYLARARHCDIGQLFRCCCRCRWLTTGWWLHLIGYGIPVVSVAALGIAYPDVYIGPRANYYWVSLDTVSEAIMIYSPALAAVLASVVLLVLLLVTGGGSHHHHQQNHLGDPTKHHDPYRGMIEVNDRRDRSVVPAMVFILTQTPNWVLANLYFLRSPADTTMTLTSSFAVINIVQAVALFVICFAQNDRVRGNIQNSLSKVQWLPTCVRSGGGKPTSMSLVGSTSSPQTPTYFYSLDPMHLAQPPSPLIRQTLQLHSNHLLRQHHNLSHQPSPVGEPGSNAVNLLRNGSVGYISEVNPYASPVPIVPGPGPLGQSGAGSGSTNTTSGGSDYNDHNYEDIGQALNSLNSFGITLPHNSHHHQHQLGHQSSATQGRKRSNQRNQLSSHQSLRRSLPPSAAGQVPLPSPLVDASGAVGDGQSLYYAPLGDGHGSSVMYGRQQPVPNYCFHNTRSPIYYSETTRR